jgi:hypothetical protein
MASTIQIKRGTGSAVPSGLSDGELAINLDNGQLYFGSGSTSVNSFRFTNLTADNYIVSSSVTNITTQTLSGSTEFGDDSADIHNRTGSLNISGALNLDGNIVGDGATTISGINTITTSGNISSSGGNVLASSFIVDSVGALDTSGTTGRLFVNSTTTQVDIGKAGAITSTKINSNVTASGDISASGYITSPRYKVAGGNSAYLYAGNGLNIRTSHGFMATEITSSGEITAADLFLDGGLNSGTPILSFSSSQTPQGGISYYDSGDAARYALFFPEPDVVSIANRASNGTVQIRANNSTAGGGGEVTSSIFTSFSNEFLLPVTASGNISASGTIYGDKAEFNQVYIGDEVALSNNSTTLYLGNSNNWAKIIYGRQDDDQHSFVGDITSSGNISSSGTIYTDNLSSPGNDLTISSTTVTLTAGTAGDANLILQADTDNNDEADNPFMLFEQDGGAIRSIIGHTGADSEWPDATPLTGGKSNNLVIGTTGSAGYTRGMQFAVLNAVAMTVSASGNIGIGTTAPTEKLTVDGNIKVTGRRFDKTSNTDGRNEGDIVYFGGTTSMTIGTIYHYKSDGTWEVTNANAAATCDGLLAVALGAASDTDGMLLRGMVTLDHDPGAVGDVLYLSAVSNGDATATAPSGNTDIVRIIGYCLDASNGQIWFNPDSTFVEVNA